MFNAAHIVEAGHRLIIGLNDGVLDASISARAASNSGTVSRTMLHSLTDMNEQLRDLCRRRRLLREELNELRYAMPYIYHMLSVRWRSILMNDII